MGFGCKDFDIRDWDIRVRLSFIDCFSVVFGLTRILLYIYELCIVALPCDEIM